LVSSRGIADEQHELLGSSLGVDEQQHSLGSGSLGAEQHVLFGAGFEEQHEPVGLGVDEQQSLSGSCFDEQHEPDPFFSTRATAAPASSALVIDSPIAFGSSMESSVDSFVVA
jgi:hypothetical protein